MRAFLPIRLYCKAFSSSVHNGFRPRWSPNLESLSEQLSLNRPTFIYVIPTYPVLRKLAIT